MKIKQNLLDLNFEELKDFLSKEVGIDEKKLKMRTQQIFSAVYQKGLVNFKDLSTMPIGLRDKLNQMFIFNNSKI